jgi:hypothetical protein
MTAVEDQVYEYVEQWMGALQDCIRCPGPPDVEARTPLQTFDCLYCMFRMWDPDEAGFQHLSVHIVRRDFPPSLVFNALRFAGEKMPKVPLGYRQGDDGNFYIGGWAMIPSRVLDALVAYLHQAI